MCNRSRTHRRNKYDVLMPSTKWPITSFHSIKKRFTMLEICGLLRKFISKLQLSYSKCNKRSGYQKQKQPMNQNEFLYKLKIIEQKRWNVNKSHNFWSDQILRKRNANINCKFYQKFVGRLISVDGAIEEMRIFFSWKFLFEHDSIKH